jgi:hypothetical protein
VFCGCATSTSTFAEVAEAPSPVSALQAIFGMPKPAWVGRLEVAIWALKQDAERVRSLSLTGSQTRHELVNRSAGN